MKLHLLLLTGLCALAPALLRADTKTFTETAIEKKGTKYWLPATITVKKGDTVKIHLVNQVPAPQGATGSVHGFAIDAYKIAEIVNQKKSKDIEFVADKTGTFPIRCQLHPVHVGGQLIVME